MRKIILLIMLLIVNITTKASFNNDSLKLLNNQIYIFTNEWLGVKYRFGGITKKGIDCSGFSRQLYMSVFNIKLPRTAREQYKSVLKVKRDSLLCGDLVFFKTNSRTGWHVGVYLSGGFFIHAQSTRTGVVITNLNSTYYTKRFFSGGRLLTI